MACSWKVHEEGSRYNVPCRQDGCFCHPSTSLFQVAGEEGWRATAICDMGCVASLLALLVAGFDALEALGSSTHVCERARA
jgi:hypothetical protein